MQVAFLEGRDLALGLAQVEEQLLLRRRSAHLHQGPGAQDVFLNGRADPPHGIGRQAEALVGIEFLDGLHQADVALGDHFADRQAVAAIAHGDLGHEAQVGGHETVGGLGVLVLAPALGEHELFVLGEHRKFADFREITGQSLFRRHHR
ncbi:hypothetical protein D3C77_447630 [compost metagenome]